MSVYFAYLVESYSGWFVVYAENRRAARREGVEEFGRGGIRDVRFASKTDCEYYQSIKGEIEEAE